jgi:hypothetical protein
MIIFVYFNLFKVPIHMRKIAELTKSLSSKRTRLNLRFNQDTIYLNATSLKNVFNLNEALVSFEKNHSIFSVKQLIDYKVEEGFYFYKDYFNLSLAKSSSDGLALKVEFKNKKMMEKAFNTNKLFNFRILAFLSDHSAFEVKRNASLNVILRVDDGVNSSPLNSLFNPKTHILVSSEKQLKPLDFEKSIYSIVVDVQSENEVSRENLIRPTLKQLSDLDLLNDEIVFSFFNEENEQPFDDELQASVFFLQI